MKSPTSIFEQNQVKIWRKKISACIEKKRS